MKFRKKATAIVEANQWFKEGDHASVRNMCNGTNPAIETTSCKVCNKPMLVHGFISTLEGEHTVCPGDWIITGVKGEHYPCKPDIFELMYEIVND
jgi:hypothetical protein